MSGLNNKGGIFEIPTLYYFKEKNKFSGSADKIFRFKISPADAMDCIVWYGKNAADRITEEDIRAKESFPLTEEGRLEMIKWLDEQYIEFAHSHLGLSDM